MELNNDNYYSTEINKKYMSFSQFKDFLKCEAYAMAKLNGMWNDEPNDALLVGSYVDNFLDGQNHLEQFITNHQELFNSRTGDLKAPYKQAQELCNLIYSDKLMKEFLTGNRQAIFECSINGIRFKAKLDSLLDNKIVDGKVLKDCENVWLDGSKKPFIFANRYDIQGAIYQLAVEQNLGKKLPFYLAVVTKEKTPDKRIFKLSDEILQDALQEVIIKAPIFNDIKQGKIAPKRCECCDYCKATKILDETKIEVI